MKSTPDPLTEAIAAAAPKARAPIKAPSKRKGRPATRVTADGQPLERKTMTVAEIAAALEVSRQAVYEWSKNGLIIPVSGRLVLADVVDWLKTRSVADAVRRSDNLDSEELELDLLRAKLFKAEFENDVLRSRYILVEDAVAVVQDAYATVRSRLTVIAPKLAQEVATERDPIEVERLIAAEIGEALAELSERGLSPRPAR